MNGFKKCEMTNCLYENLTKGPYCTNCNANIRTWSKRPVAQLLERKRKLSLYSGRMSEVGPVEQPVKRRRKK